MAGLLDSQPAYGNALEQQPTYTNLFDQRAGLIDRTASGQAISPQENAKYDQDAATFFGEIRKGLRRSGFSMMGSAQAAAGSLIAPVAPETGQGLIQQGLRTAENQPEELRPAISGWSGVHDPRSAMLQVGSAFGEGAPSAALTVAGGLGGRALGAGIGALRGLRGAQLGAAAARGGWAGGIGTMLPGEMGETAMELAQDPQAMANTTPLQRLGLTATRGGVNAALENIVPQMLVVPRILGKAARIQPGFGPGLRNIGLIGAEGALGEYGTEAAQELTGQFAQNIAHPGVGYDLAKAHEAGLSGAVVGGVLGGAGGVAQGIHSNVGPAIDKARELAGQGAEAVKGKLPSLPTFDDLIGHARDISEDPEAAGVALGKSTLEGVAKAAEAADALRKYGVKGLDTAEDYLSKMYDGTAKFIRDRVTDPADQEWFLHRAADLKAMTLPEWRIFRRDLADKSGSEFLDHTALAATLLGRKAVRGAEAAGGWLSKMAGGFYDTISKAVGGQTASISMPDENDRKTAMGQFYAAAPGLREIIESPGTEPKAKRALANVLHFAINNPSYFEGEDVDPARQQALQDWKDNTGTDFVKIMAAIRSGRNDVTHQEIATDALSGTLHTAGIDAKHHDDIVELVTDNTDKSYDELARPTQLLLNHFSMGHLTKLQMLMYKQLVAKPAGDLSKPQTEQLAKLKKELDVHSEALYNTLNKRVTEGLMRQERDVGEAGRFPSQMQQLTENMRTGALTRVAPSSEGEAETFVDSKGNKWIRNEDGELVNAEPETKSPFTHQVIKESLSTHKYRTNPDTSIPVTLFPQGEHAKLSPRKILNALGGRRDQENKQDVYTPYKAKEVPRSGKKGITTHISPMSLLAAVQSEAHRDQFQEHMIGLDDRPGASSDEIKGQRYMNIIATLAERGIHIDPELVGLPAGSEPVHVKAEFNLQDIPDTLVLKRYAKDALGNRRPDLTWGDITGAKRAAGSFREHAKRLEEFKGDFHGAYKKLEKEGAGDRRLLAQANRMAGAAGKRTKEELEKIADLRARGSADPVAKRLASLAWSRARNRVREEEGLEADDPVRPTTSDERDAALEEYLKDLPDLQERMELRKQLRHQAETVRLEYKDGNLSDQDVNAISQYYSNPDPDDKEKVVSILEGINEELIEDPRADTAKFADELETTREAADFAQEEFEKTKHGEAEDTSVQNTIEREWREFKLSAVQRSHRVQLATDRSAAARGLGKKAPGKNEPTRDMSREVGEVTRRFNTEVQNRHRYIETMWPPPKSLPKSASLKQKEAAATAHRARRKEIDGLFNERLKQGPSAVEDLKAQKITFKEAWDRTEQDLKDLDKKLAPFYAEHKIVPREHRATEPPHIPLLKGKELPAPTVGSRLAIAWKIKNEMRKRSAAKYKITAVEKLDNGKYKFSFENVDEGDDNFGKEYKDHIADENGVGSKGHQYYFTKTKPQAAHKELISYFEKEVKARIDHLKTQVKTLPMTEQQSLKIDEIEATLPSADREQMLNDLRTNKVTPEQARKDIDQMLSEIDEQLRIEVYDPTNLTPYPTAEQKKNVTDLDTGTKEIIAALSKHLAGIRDGVLKGFKGDADVLTKLKKVFDTTAEHITQAYDEIREELKKSDVKAVIADFTKAITESLNNAIEQYTGKKPAPAKTVAPTGVTIHSGGAKGSDTLFGQIGAELGMKTVAHSFEKHNIQRGSGNRLQHTNEELAQADKLLETVNDKYLKRNISKSNPYVINLFRRNYFQVKDSEAVVAISKGFDKNKMPDGGTGWAAAMGIELGKPVHLYDIPSGKWLKWDGSKFAASERPPPYQTFAGVGTRELDKEGKAEAAIRDYLSSFKGAKTAEAAPDAWKATPGGEHHLKTAEGGEYSIYPADEGFDLTHITKEGLANEDTDQATHLGNFDTVEAAKAAADKHAGKKPAAAKAAPAHTGKYDKTLPMYFKDNETYSGVLHKMRPGFEGRTTLELIKAGERTATTRGEDQIRDLKVDDVVRFTAKGQDPVFVRVTKAAYPVSSISKEAWSEREGWAESLHAHYAQRNASQFMYKLIGPTTPLEGKVTPAATPTPTPTPTTGEFTAADDVAMKQGMNDAIGVILARKPTPDTAKAVGTLKKMLASTPQARADYLNKTRSWWANLARHRANDARNAGGTPTPPTPPTPPPTPPPGGPPTPPPPPPPPPPPGGTPPTPPPGKGKKGKIPNQAAKKRFLAIVHSMMGDKKIRVRFDQALEGGVKGTFYTREEALKKVRGTLRSLGEQLGTAQTRSNNQKQIDEITAKIKVLQDRENDLLTDTAVQGYIDLAAGMEKKAGLAEHETFHAAFHIFFTAEEKRILGQAFTHGLAGKRLRQIFKDDPIVLARINDPLQSEEAAAYAFEVWAADPDSFQLGPQVKTLFERFLNFIKKLFGVLSMEEKAGLIFESLKSGERHQTAISPVERVLNKDKPWQTRAQEMVKDVGGLIKNGYDILLGPSYERLVGSDNPALTAAAKLGYEETGAEGNEGGMVQRGRKVFKIHLNKLGAIFKDLSEDQLKEMHLAMVHDRPPSKIDPEILDRVVALRQWYKDMYKYQTDAGVLLKDAGIKQGYYPLTWSPEKVLKNKKAFIDMLNDNYANELLTTKKTANAIYESITGYIDRGEDLVDVMGANKEPLSEATKTRTLAFIEKKHRLPFMDEDPIHTSHRYMKQAVRQAEYIRSYGMRSTKLIALRDQARDKYGATPGELALLNDYVDGLMGNKEIGMSRELKDLYGALNVYQNYRLLPFNLFASLVDPMGIAIRSGSTMDAWNTFTYSIKNLFKEWKSDYPRDFFEKYAEDMGIIEHSGTTISAHNQFDGITLRGTTKDLNDKLFKYNLLNGWIRNNTIMAVKAGQRFIYRSANGDMGDERSARYLEELGLTKDDVVYDEGQQRLLLHANELEAAGKSKEDAKAIETKLSNAIEKFVRQSLLNPSSAELPNWASNPYLMPIAHLKQFVFAFNATIMNRIWHEMKHGNMQPAMLAAAYVPSMIAADFLKDMIAGFGDEPPYKKNWGLYDYVMNGVDRSGLTGTGQFFKSANEDIIRQGSGLENFAGPAAQQVRQGFQAFGSGNGTAITNFMVKSVPLQPVFRPYLPSPFSGGAGATAQ